MMFDKSRLQKINHFLLSMVDEGQIPGAVYGIVTANETIVENAFGLAHKDLQIPMSTETIFDLASLTKVCATTPGILLLIEDGQIDLDDPVKRFFPETTNSNLTIKHLLTHTSGFPPHIPYYQLGFTKKDVLKDIVKREVSIDKEVAYSDLNFILLGSIIEQVAKMSLDEFTKKQIYEPLGMTHTGFNLKIEKEKVAPTEWIEEKGDYQWGAVHDENAHHLGGVCGHAGLFSNLHDLKIYVQMLLRDGVTESGSPFLSASTLLASRRNYTKSLNLNRGLGWQLVDDAFSPLGYFLSKESFGHTGFTGTSFWIDPDRKIGVIILSNRVHISRSINMNRIRRVVHNIVASSWSD